MIQQFTNFLPFDVSGPVVTGRLKGGWRPNLKPLAGYITSGAVVRTQLLRVMVAS